MYETIRRDPPRTLLGLRDGIVAGDFFMVLPDIIFSLFIASCVSLVFAIILQRRGRRKGFVWFFLTIFLSVIAVGTWTKPYGVPLSGSNWLPFLLAAIGMALLLSVLAPKLSKVGRQAQLDREETMEMLESIEREKEVEVVAYITFNLVFWALILLLFAAILVKYLA
jgi:hypothetical protein